MSKNIKQAAEYLKKALSLLTGDDESAAVEMPSVKAVAKLDLAGLSAVAVSFGIEAGGLKEKALRALITTAAKVVAEGAEGEYTAEEVSALCSAVGLTVGKKAAANITALAEYFETAKDAEDGDDEESEESDEDEESEEDGDDEESDDDEEEKPAKGKKAKSKAKPDDDDDEESDEDDDEESDDDDDEKSDDDDDEESDEDDDDDEKPAKGKKAKAKADDDEEESDDEESDEDEESDDDEESEDDEEEEVSPKEQAKRLAAYNKAKPAKPAKTYADVVKALKGNAWGVAYAVDEDGYCCGFPLKSAKVGKTPVGKCRVTGKTFAQNDEGELVEFNEEN